jgi:hypothetical protein
MICVEGGQSTLGIVFSLSLLVRDCIVLYFTSRQYLQHSMVAFYHVCS